MKRAFIPARGIWPLANRPVLRVVLVCAALIVITVSTLLPRVLPNAPTLAAGYSLAIPQESVHRGSISLMLQAMQLLAEEGHAQPNSNDPNQTGLIGPEWSDITSTLGDLEAKRTALTPLWAGVTVDELSTMGLKRGDILAVSQSGSFPGLNIAVLAAAQAMGLQVRLVASPTASMFGANRPDFAWTDMLRELDRAKWLQNTDWVITPGGGSDLGKGLLTDRPDILQGIMDRSGAPILTGRSLHEMVAARWQFYQQNGKVAAFVNIGGSHAALGECPPPAAWHGRLKGTWTCKGEPGLLWLFQDAGIPTLHFLNIKELALEHGISLDPVPLPGWNDSSGLRERNLAAQSNGTANAGGTTH